MDYVPFNSQILQKKEGYREIFHYFLMLEFSFRLSWDEINNQFKGFEKKLSELYETNTEAKTRQYQAMVDMTKGKKLVTVSECGNIPDPAKCMAAGNKWSWFMVWCNSDSNGNIVLTPSDGNFNLNTGDYWKQVMSSPYVMTRESMPNLK